MSRRMNPSDRFFFPICAQADSWQLMYSFRSDSHCAGCLRLFECRYCCVSSALKLLLTLAPKPDYHSSVGQTHTHTHTFVPFLCCTSTPPHLPPPSDDSRPLCHRNARVVRRVAAWQLVFAAAKVTWQKPFSALNLSTTAVSPDGVPFQTVLFFLCSKIKSNIYACKSFVTVTPGSARCLSLSVGLYQSQTSQSANEKNI